MRLLKRTHAAIRASHKNAHALLTAHRIFGRTTGIATGSAQNIQLFAPARQLVLKQIAQQLHSHVFKRQRRAIGQGFQVETGLAELGIWRFQRFKGHDLRCAKHFFGVGLLADGLQVGRWNVVDEQRQNLECQVGVATALAFAESAAQAVKRSCVDLRIRLG